MMTHPLNISVCAGKLRDSITHGTKARIAQLNEHLSDEQKVIDLSIGTLDEKTDHRIDDEVLEFIRNSPEKIHEFAPVCGFHFVRDAISKRVSRLRGIDYSSDDEIMVTPGGIKGAITVVFNTLLDPGDEVIVPLPNWPHYADMIELNGGCIQGVFTEEFRTLGLTPEALDHAINSKTKMVILGDCVNPSGKIYTQDEITALAQVIAFHNVKRENEGQKQIHVLYDCPYEAHILDDTPSTISKVEVTLPDQQKYAMRDCTTIVTGPGKTYGMHGDRIGYICTSKPYREIMEKVQVNINSFASTYGQVATFAAMDEALDSVAQHRARQSRESLSKFLSMLNEIPGIHAPSPDGGYFIFIDLSELKSAMLAKGYDRADEFLLEEARVASISGIHFAENIPEMKCFVRMNCGRDLSHLQEAAKRIDQSIRALDYRPVSVGQDY